MNGGDDKFSATGNLAALINLTIDGGAGNDTILGGNGNDRLIGGDGNDFIDGNQGSDTAFLGAGDDVFQWDPGDGNDTVEGEDGTDTMLFNGANIAEIFEMSANGERLRFTRDIGNIVMDVNGVEIVTVNALGGADIVNIGDLSGTDVQTVNVNLGSTIGGTAGDAADRHGERQRDPGRRYHQRCRCGDFRVGRGPVDPGERYGLGRCERQPRRQGPRRQRHDRRIRPRRRRRQAHH